jgi:hypothetical protein
MTDRALPGGSTIDRNRNGIDDAIEPPDVDVEASEHQFEQKLAANTSTSPILSGGDVDADWADAEGSGEETVGGSVATPDQNVVEELGEAVGVTYEDSEVLRAGEKEEERDEHRWELDPASAEDYAARSHEGPQKKGKSPFVR